MIWLLVALNLAAGLYPLRAGRCRVSAGDREAGLAVAVIMMMCSATPVAIGI